MNSVHYLFQFFSRVGREIATFLTLLAVSTTVSAQTGVGTSWTLRNPFPTQEYLQAVTWTGSQAVAVGQGGTVLTSPDGVAWTKRSSGVTTALSAVIWSGSQLLAVGDGGVALTSTNGITWTRRTTGVTKGLRAAVWTGSQFIVVGEDGTALTSSAGSTWVVRFTGTSADLNALAWTGTQAFALGDTGVALSSSTGSSWTQVSQSPALNFTSVAWSGSQLIAVTQGGTVQTSVNASSWTQQHATGGASLLAVTWTGSEAIAVGSGGTIITSPTGISWAAGSSGVGQFLFGVVHAGSKELAVGAGGILLDSSDAGASWTKRTQVSTSDLMDLAWNGTTLIAVGKGGSVLTSSTGQAWVVQASGTLEDLESATWAGTQVIAVGALGTILTSSTNGTSWSSQSSGTIERLLGVVWNRSVAVAVGENGTVLRSVDGFTWSTQTSGTAQHLRSVTVHGGLFYAVGAGGTIIRSADGITWTLATVAPFETLTEVTSAGGQLVAVGEADTILTSPTGVTWTQRPISFGQNLHGVAWTGSQLAAVGTFQTILTSPTGVTWTKPVPNSATLPRLNSVEWIGSQLVAVGDGGCILTSGTLTAPIPVVSLALGSDSAAETDGIITLNVDLSFAPSASTTIPFTVSGTLSSGLDYVLAASPVTFAAGQSTRPLSISLINDALVEGVETLDIVIGSPAKALIGGINRYTLTVSSEDVAPVINLQPQSQIVAMGAPVTTFTTSATGVSAPTYQWRKNGTAIASATGSNYSVFNAGLSHAGTYSVTASNPTSSVNSSSALLAVVDTGNYSLQVPVNGTATMTCAAAGSSLSYQWFKDGNPMSNGGRISGATTPTLKITGVLAGDTATYECDVTLPGVGTLTGVTWTYDTLLPPVVNPPSLAGTMVGATFTHSLSATNFPSSYTVSGLPAGLVASTAGVISGRPTASGTYLISITAKNAAGTSPIERATLVVQAIPKGALGSFTGIITRDSLLNNNLGGALDFSISATGSYTGSVRLAGVSYPITGVVDSAFNAAPQINRIIDRPTPQVDLTLSITFSPGTHSFSGSISAGPSASISGHRRVWNTVTNPAEDHTGHYSIGLQLQPLDVGDASLPQGVGYATFTVGLDGGLTLSGRAADGGVIAMSTFLGPNGELLIYQPMFANTESLLGSQTLALDPALSFLLNEVTGTLSWQRLPQAPLTERVYRLGFGPITVNVQGRYLSTASGKLIQGLPSTGTLSVAFTEGGVGLSAVDPSVSSATYTNALTVIMPTAGGPSNPGRTTLSINTTSGAMSGTFQLLDGATLRNVSYVGQIIRTPSGIIRGSGYFLLPQLPNVTTSAILSGRVDIQ